MLNSEKKSLIRFLIIYLVSTLLLFSLASWIFYILTKNNLLEQQKKSLRYEANYIKFNLRTLHISDDKKLLYPKSKTVESAIYDLDKRYIYGTFKEPFDQLNENERLYQVLYLEPYYLGAAYLKVYKNIDFAPIENLQKQMLLFMFIIVVFLSILGYFLGKLFIAPMRDSMKRMNRFIQDATHELNTPISTILTNIEMIETLEKHTQSSAELKRVEIASKTLSRIYDDLAYLNLNHQYHRQIEKLDMSFLVKERILYFLTLINAKSLKLIKKIEPNIILYIDKNDAIRLIDNLISNAIKYNKLNGLLHIELTKKEFIVKDSGVGIKPKDLANITKRFKRANSSEGGFGIGLDIVEQVAKSYNFDLDIDSKIDIGTKVALTWKK